MLKLVDRVPPADPVLEEDEDAVFAGDAAVGTLLTPVTPVTPPENCKIKPYITLYEILYKYYF